MRPSPPYPEAATHHSSIHKAAILLAVRLRGVCLMPSRCPPLAQKIAVPSHREKDGLWAVLAWLSILAHANGCVSTKSGNPLGKLIKVRHRDLSKCFEPPRSQDSRMPAAGSCWQAVLCQAGAQSSLACLVWLVVSALSGRNICHLHRREYSRMCDAPLGSLHFLPAGGAGRQ